MDLTQAEGISEKIGSGSSELGLIALQAMNGEVSRSIEKLKSRLKDCQSFIELEMDFMEQGYEGEGVKSAKNLLGEIDKIFLGFRSRYQSIQILKSGLTVTISGVPNSGKSSLFNAMTGVESSIVTDVPGTTRDPIKENIQLNNLRFSLCDTAGLCESEDLIEKLGIEKAQNLLRQTNLNLFLIDPTQLEKSLGTYFPLSEGIKEKTILLLGKSDLEKSNFSLNDEWAKIKNQIFQSTGKVSLEVSALKEFGLKEIEGKIQSFFNEKVSFTLEDEVGASLFTERQNILLEKSYEKFQNFKSTLVGRDTSESYENSPEILSLLLKESVDPLEEVIGKIRPKDVIENVFQHFCIGK